jgi:hypothetical protein
MPLISDTKGRRERSPAYPSVDLKTAIDYAKMIYQKEKRHPATVSVVAAHCGSNIKSSKGLRLIAALKQFGLVIEEGEGEDRCVRLTERALDIIVETNEQSPAWNNAVRQAALAPKIYKMLWDEYKGSLPSDDTLRVHLIRKLQFNSDSVRPFIKELRATLLFSGQLESDTIGETDENYHDDHDDVESPGEEKSMSNSGLLAPVKENENFPSGPSCPTGLIELRTVLDEGPVILRCPDNLSKDSAEDLQYWFDGLMRRVRRKAGLSPQEPA